MKLNVLSITALTSLCCLAFPIHAHTLEGELDGETRQWHILERGGNSTAYYSSFGAGMQTLTIQGHAENRYAMQGTLSINLTVMNGNLLGDPEVSYFPESRMFPSYSSEDGSATLQNFSMKQQGDHIHVSGEVLGNLYRMEGIGQDTNYDDTISINVRFDTELREEN